MASFNKVIIIGNLTRDVELRYTPKGTAVAKIGLAMNRKWRDESGESKEETTFVDVDAFGRQAETLAQFMKKGRPLLVEGRLRLDTWEDKQTSQKRSKLGIVLENFRFIDAGARPPDETEDLSARAANPSQSSSPPPPPAQTANEPPAEDDDVPF